MPEMKLGVSWFRERDFPRWRELDPQFCRDYDVWLSRMGRAKASFKTEGIVLVPVPVTPDEFVAWADASGRDYGQASRAAYVAVKVKNMTDAH